jgi:hypothetical protein
MSRKNYERLISQMIFCLSFVFGHKSHASGGHFCDAFADAFRRELDDKNLADLFRSVYP